MWLRGYAGEWRAALLAMLAQVERAIQGPQAGVALATEQVFDLYPFEAIVRTATAKGCVLATGSRSSMASSRARSAGGPGRTTACT